MHDKLRYETDRTSADYEALFVEQANDQADKHRSRMLAEYNALIFPGQGKSMYPGAVVDFLRPFCASEVVSLPGVLEGAANLLGRQIHWAEMGGGLCLTMREMALLPNMKSKVKMTNVDLFDMDLNEMPRENINYLQKHFPGITDLENEPEFIQGNIEAVSLPQPADLITSVETMQYLNDPLAAICNWYNQLSDYGVLIISTERDWPAWIRYHNEFTKTPADTPAAHFFDELLKSGVRFAAANIDNSPGYRPAVRADNFRTLAIQKKPDTALSCNSAVAKIWKNPSNFKVTYYTKPQSQPIIELVRA